MSLVSPASVSADDDHQHNPSGVIKPMTPHRGSRQGVVPQARQVCDRVYPWPLGPLPEELLGSICMVGLSQVPAQTQI